MRKLSKSRAQRCRIWFFLILLVAHVSRQYSTKLQYLIFTFHRSHRRKIRFSDYRILPIANLLLCTVMLIMSTYSCTTSLGDKKAIEPPNWYLNPPANTVVDFYGVASAHNLDQAKRKSLEDVAANLGIQISGQSLIISTKKDGVGTSHFTEETSAVVGNTEFSNYTYLKTDHDPATNTYWVLVKVDKKKLLADIKYQSDKLTRELENDFGYFDRASNLAQVLSSEELRYKAAKLERLCNTRRYLDNNFNPDPILEDLRQKAKKLQQALESLKVFVKHDVNTEHLAQNLEQLLTENKVKVVGSANVSGATTISITSNVIFSFVYDHVAKLNVKLESIDENGKILLTSNFEEAGASPSSDRAALEQANYKIAENFKKQGLLNSLGF